MSSLPASFGAYVEQLEQLTRVSPDRETLRPHLDGEVSRRLRGTVKLDDLRQIGAFFTGETLAAKLLAGVPKDVQRFADPACGCGDLLLCASARLPIAGSLQETLRHWNTRLAGRDAVPLFPRAARARLALAAVARGAAVDAQDTPDAPSLLTNIAYGDGLELEHDGGTTILLNPPYGRVAAPSDCGWASGLTTEAAVFLDAVVDNADPGARVAAVLPEVLRAGSRYARLRASLSERLAISAIKPAGVFDALTDVDVFLLHARVGGGLGSATWPDAALGDRTLADLCEVRVGTVVANRDKHAGPAHPYLDARTLGLGGTVTATSTRRFEGTVFTPPFVVCGRTNRPAESGRPRLRATIVTGSQPVALENHLLAFLPKKQTMETCRAVVALLEADATTAYLDGRLRCRHLTVGAMKGVPR